jgi:hypothetical protein
MEIYIYVVTASGKPIVAYYSYGEAKADANKRQEENNKAVINNPVINYGYIFDVKGIKLHGVPPQ